MSACRIDLSRSEEAKAYAAISVLSFEFSVLGSLAPSAEIASSSLIVPGVLSPVFRLRSSRRCAAISSPLRARAFHRCIVASDELAPGGGETPRAGRNHHRGAT